MTDTFDHTPEEIDASKHFGNAFDHHETEVSAGWIVRFCQERNKGWEPFTFKDIDGYYQSKGLHDGFWFNRLIGENYIRVNISTGMYFITNAFVNRCYKSSPAKKD